MTFSLIYARDIHGCIGKSNTIPWRSPTDIDRFKQLTVGKICLMGRKTFDSLPKPLSDRHHVVVTQTGWTKLENTENVSQCLSLLSARRECKDLINNYGWPEEVMVIGGARIYQQMLPFCTRVYSTTMDLEVENGDTFFSFQPKEEDGWKQIYNKTCDSDTLIKHWFTIHQRKPSHEITV